MTEIPKYYDSGELGILRKPRYTEVKDAARMVSLSLRPKRFDTLLISVDILNDFHALRDPEGIWTPALPVDKSVYDLERLLVWGYRNAESIDGVMNLRDKHQRDYWHIFASKWWSDPQGKHPDLFTEITLEDVRAIRWQPTVELALTPRVMKKVKKITIWPEHCLEGSIGARLVPAYQEFITYLRQGRGVKVINVYKGKPEWVEFYGGFWPNVILPEMPEVGVNHKTLAELPNYKRIVVTGQARDYCVIETLMQIYVYFAARGDGRFLERVYFLDDCSSSVGDGIEAEERLRFLAKYGGLNIVRSKEFKL